MLAVLLVVLIAILFLIFKFEINTVTVFAMAGLIVLFFVFSVFLIYYRIERFILKKIKTIYSDLAPAGVSMSQQTIQSDMEALRFSMQKFADDKKLEIEQISKSNIQRDHAKDQNLPVVYEKKKNIPLPFLVLLVPVIFIAIEMIIRNSNINALEFSKELNNLIETIVNIIGSLFSS